MITAQFITSFDHNKAFKVSHFLKTSQVTCRFDVSRYRSPRFYVASRDEVSMNSAMDGFFLNTAADVIEFAQAYMKCT